MEEVLWNYVNILFPIKLSLIDLTFIHDFFPNQVLLEELPNGDFLNKLSIYLELTIQLLGKGFSSPIYSFIYV